MSHETPLGKPTIYADRYDPGLLFAIPRAESRAALDLAADLPFTGCDLWTAWEITWLNRAGVPQIDSAEIRVPADTPYLIESKSLKLYLGSFAMSHYADAAALLHTIEADLSACTQGSVQVRLHAGSHRTDVAEFTGVCVDTVDVACEVYDVDASLLAAGSERVTESLYSHVLRSLCPVTNQPDLGSVLINYSGPQIDPASLLRYIVSFRQHNDFHEACVERMFMDIRERCGAEQLTVYARYQRRGGIDINPFRSNFEASPAHYRLRRQ